MRVFTLSVLLLLMAVPAAAHGYQPVFEPGDCPFPASGLDVSCGTLIVPEDRDNPDDAQVELAVAIIPAANDSPEPDPIIYLEGGPGGSGLYAAQDFQTHPLRQNRDLILLDQRGTGFSVPSLNCFEMEDFEYDGDPLADCFDRLLNDGVDLDQYNSADSAADVNDLRIALGYDQVNLWGISYGTRLALTVMRDHPDGLRAVVIDSVFPPEVNSVESGVNDTLNAFGYLFEQCAADSTCSSAYPNLEQDFLDVIDGFNNNPPVFEYDDGFEVYELELYGDDIAGALFQTLYNSTAIPMLPLGITLLATAQDEFDLQDGYDIMQGFYTPESWNGEFEDGPESVFESDQVFDYIDQVGDISDSEGMYSSVECAEEIPFNDLDAAFDVADANAPEELLEWLYISAETPVFDCDIWFVEPLPGVENERVQSDIPTLLISGGFDPVTPPSYGDSALEGLSNGQHVVFPFGGHSETGTEGCAADLAAAFVDEPGAAVDASCVPQTIDFYVE